MDDDWMTGKPKWLVWIGVIIAAWAIVMFVGAVTVLVGVGLWKLVHW